MKRSIPAVLLVGTLALAACGSSSKSSNGSGSTGSSGSSSTSSTTTASSGSSGSSGTSGTTGTSGANSAAVSYSGPAATLNEAGSTLLYPYLETIQAPLHKALPKLTLKPGPGGSGEGLTDAATGTTDWGGSDAYLSPTSMQEYPSLVNIPLVVSSQAIDVNIPGVKSMRLSGPILAEIYSGQITNWDDAAIKKLNPTIKLPSLTIHPIHRSDSSGDSFLFSTFLSDTSPSWASKTGGPSEAPNWPQVSASSTAQGNPGMAQACQSTKGCVAYIGISEQADALKMGLGEAAVENKAGQFEVSSSATVTSAVTSSLGRIPSSLAVSLVDASGSNSYPIVNFEYAIVKKGSSKAAALKALFDYIIDTKGGSSPSYLAANQFQPLPSAVVARVKAAINSI